MISAAKAGVCRNTATKYLKEPEPPGAPSPRGWRTRRDPLIAIWAEAEEMLREKIAWLDRFLQ